MEAAYDGRQVVGMDLHRRRSVLVRMTEDGRRLGHGHGSYQGNRGRQSRTPLRSARTPQNPR